METKDFWTIASLFLATVALIFTFRKDAHHLRLDLTYIEFNGVVLGVNNDSSVPFGILSVGFFNSAGQIEWIRQVGDYITNKWVTYPVRVEARSLRSISLVAPRDVPHQNEPHGYCVQLETGRLYVLRNSAPTDVWLRLQFASFASRLSRGAWIPCVQNRPRLPTRL